MNKIALATALLLALPLFAQEGAVREDLRDWEYRFPLRGTAGKALNSVEVTPAVFGSARSDLGDLRLIDGNGQSIPYALRELRERQLRKKIPTEGAFDRQTLPDGSDRLSLDLGASPPQHNEVRVDVSATSYGRPLVLEGSDDGKNWGVILSDVEVVRLTASGQSINVTSFKYPPSRNRFLRATLKPDRVEKTRSVLLGAEILFSVDQPGRLSEGKAQVEYHDPVRENYSDPATAWVFNLGAENVPVSRLTLKIEQQQFRRPFRLEVYEPGRSGRTVTSGTLSRDSGNEPLVLEFPEVRAHRLKLTVIDSRNKALRLSDATYAAAARVLLFEKPAGAGEPLRLFVGNRSAESPNYDFAATVPSVVQDLTPWTLQGREENPAYVPPPPAELPFTERYPFLLDGVLLLSLAVLGYLLYLLARTAIQRHDGQVSMS